MSIDQITNVFIPLVALGLVVGSLAQLIRGRDRLWPFRIGQSLVLLGILALSANLLFGRDDTFAIVSSRIAVWSCVAGGIVVLGSMLVKRAPTHDRPA